MQPRRVGRRREFRRIDASDRPRHVAIGAADDVIGILNQDRAGGDLAAGGDGDAGTDEGTGPAAGAEDAGPAGDGAAFIADGNGAAKIEVE